MKSTNLSPSFQTYLKNQFLPAQEWCKSNDGKNWIINHIPSLAKLIETDYDSVLFAVYMLSINHKPVYIGESLRTCRRLVVHAYNLCQHPELFGMTQNEVDQCEIEIQLLSKHNYNQQARREEELYFINKFKPLFQRNCADTCIPRKDRRTCALTYVL